MGACLDTNVVVAAFATRGLCADVLRTVIADHELVLGEVILEEPERALTLELGVLETVLAHVKAARATAVLVPRPAASHPMALRDAADRWVVATAVAGDADGTGACRASGLLILTGGTGTHAPGDTAREQRRHHVGATRRRMRVVGEAPEQLGPGRIDDRRHLPRGAERDRHPLA